METTKSIVELHDGAAVTDTTSEFEHLRAATSELFDLVTGRFDVEPDPATEPFHTYGVDGGPSGSIRGYAGAEIDWLIHSWIGNPAIGFTNIHLSVWNGAQTLVPHLGLAWGTLPDYWYFVDYVPRVDLLADAAYLDRYYQPHNSQVLELRERAGYSPFVSQNLYIRQSVSHTALCFICERRPDMVEEMVDLARGRVLDWIGHHDEGHPVPPSERGALAERDLYVRRTVAERDPANVMGERFFGAELTDGLVRALWGGDRTLPRAT